MNKLVLIVAGVTLASTAAHAGPLATPLKNSVAAPRIAPVAARMPAMSAMPALSGAGALPGLQATPCVGNVCVPGIDVPPLAEGPLQQPWVQYNIKQWPKDVQAFAHHAAIATVELAQETVDEAQHPCGGSDSGTGCNTNIGGVDVPVGMVTGQVGVVSNFANKALGFIGGGGIGPIPLPKMPGDP